MDPPDRKRPHPDGETSENRSKSHRHDEEGRHRREDRDRSDSRHRREESGGSSSSRRHRDDNGRSRREGDERRPHHHRHHDRDRDRDRDEERRRRSSSANESNGGGNGASGGGGGSSGSSGSPPERNQDHRGRIPRAPESTRSGYSAATALVQKNSHNGTRNGSGGHGQSSSQSRLQNLAERSTVDLQDENQRKRHDQVRREGTRARKPRPTDAQQQDFVQTRTVGFVKTVDPAQSKATTNCKLVGNYFPLNSRAKFNLYHYHVDFSPDNLKTFQKRGLWQPIAQQLGTFNIFDGSALYVCTKIPDGVPKEFYVAAAGSNQKVTISIKLVNEITPFDPINIQVYNTLIRHCMRELQLTQMGRHYYDPKLAVINGQARLEMWPGYKTSLRQHERSLMLCVEMTNKVLRQDTVLDIIYSYPGDRKPLEQMLLNSIVMTDYNRKTYRIDQVAWNETPRTKTFQIKSRDQPRDETGVETNLMEYMYNRYRIQLRNPDQPLLYSRAKKAEIRRGMAEKVAIIPELCRLTGLSDEHRKNFTLMRDLNKTLQLNPEDRIKAIQSFSTRLQVAGIQQKVLAPVGLSLDPKLVSLNARKYNPETILFGDQHGGGEWVLGPGQRYDWINKQQGGPMRSCKTLKHWTVISSDSRAETFVQMIIEKAKRMGFDISPNFERELVGRPATVQNYSQAIDQAMAKHKSNLQMLLIFLPRQEEYLYGAVKRRCYYDYGIPSQCVQERHLTPRPGRDGAQSGVAVKVAVQMNAKLGGIPWELKSLPKGAMVVGFNISQSARSSGSAPRSRVGALVATTNDAMSQYFSVVVPFARDETLSSLLHHKISLIINGYKEKNNGNLPKRIIFYRDGVGEGQLQSVVDTEITQMKETIKSAYPPDPKMQPQFTFIVVNKRLNTKFFLNEHGRFMNPGPGTCVDDIITLPERYDFFLISQTGTGQGTVSPASYNVICNESGGQVGVLSPYHLQMLTYKLCHLYYNWTSTVAVPSVCQYAHKLAFLQNIIKKSGGADCLEAQTQLHHSLYYL